MRRAAEGRGHELRGAGAARLHDKLLMLAAAKFEAKQQKLQDAQKKGAAALEVAQHHHTLNPKPLL